MSKTKTYAAPSGADWMARIFSLGSILIAFFALYINALAPADMNVMLISPEFQLQQRDTDLTVPMGNGIQAVRAHSSFLMIGNCVFSNNGAQIGNISAMVVELVSDDGTTWLFAPFKMVDDLPRITGADGVVGYEISKALNFSPILLPGKQTSRHTFLFTLENNSPDFIPTTHKFHVNLWVWYGLSPEPHKQEVANIDFNDLVVATLKKGVLEGVPFDEQRAQIHQIAK